MDAALKDLLQLGFSFFVAGYLLVWGHRVQVELQGAVRGQTVELVALRLVMVEVRDLLRRVKA